MEAAQLCTPTTTSNSVYGNGKTSSLCSILRCVGILGRRDVELNMFAQASILKKGVEGVLAGQASILNKGVEGVLTGHARIRPTTVGRKSCWLKLTHCSTNLCVHSLDCYSAAVCMRTQGSQARY